MDHDVKHDKIGRVDGDIFTLTFTPDCMVHKCQCRGEGGEGKDRALDDACCRHGADVFVPEKNAILRRTREIASVLEDARRDPAGWFDERDPEPDPEAPAGVILRTATSDPDDETSGCVFLEHTGERGCGLHRAAVLHGFEPSEIKPAVCRLYPLSWSDRRLELSSDFNLYSCASASGPTVYRLMRDVIGDIFGISLVGELDRLEAQLARRRLLVLTQPAA